MAMINKGMLPKEANIPEGADPGINLEDLVPTPEGGEDGKGDRWAPIIKTATDIFTNQIKTTATTGQTTPAGNLLTGGTINQQGKIQPTGVSSGGGIDNKILLIGGAAVVAAAFLLKRK